ncbi:MAG TPA: PAS domain S-box protein, partial [Verrucomicrobiae bacterium]
MACNGALTEQALRASELSYRRLFEAAKDGILILDVDTRRISDVNPFLIDLLGFSHSEMVGKTVGEVGPFKNNGSDKIMFERLQTDGYIRCDNLPLETRDGRRIAVELIGNVYQAGDKKMIQCHIRDITGHKRVEAVLTESEQRFEALFEDAREGVFQSTLGGQFRLANPAMARMLGYASSQELIAGVTDIGRQLNVDTGVRAEFQRRITERGEVQDFEFQARRKDGATIWLSENAHAVRDANGAVLYYEGMLQDITERRRAEELLHHEQTLMATLMENIPDGIYFKDTASRFLRVNSAQFRKFGLSDPAQIVGKSDADFFSGEHARQALADEQEIIRTGWPLLNVEEKETWPDGTVGWVLTTKLPLRDAEGRIIGTCGISRDITERKRADEAVRESERRFQTLANTSPIGIFQTDAQGQTTYVNPRWCQITGLSATNALGDRWLGAVHPEDRGTLAQGWQTATQAQSTSKTDYRFVHPDGSISWVMGQAVPEKDDAGRVVGYVGTITDITERKRAEAALQMFQFATDRAADAVFWINRDGSFFYVNDQACHSTGYAREELMRLRLFDIDPDFSEERWKENWLRFEHNEMATNRLESTHRRKDGSSFPVEVTTRHFSTDGVVVRVAFVRDITERKQAEEFQARLATAVEQAAETIMITDTRGTILYVNPAFEKTSGYTRAEALGQNPR